MYRGSLQEFYCNKGIYECKVVPCVYFHIKITEMKHYVTKILKSDTPSVYMNKKIDHWLD